MAVRRSAFDSEKWETPYHGKWKRRVSRIVIPSEVEGYFSLAVRRSVFDSEERETSCRGKAGAVLPVNGLAKKSGKKGTKKISRCARNDSVGDGYPVHHTKNVWEKHVSRIVIGSGAEGSFSLAVKGRVSDSEERETPYRGKAGAVLPVNGLAKKSGKKGTKKISRCARNDGIEQSVCLGNKKRGGIPLFLYFDGSPSSSLSSPTVSAIASAPWAASSSRLP